MRRRGAARLANADEDAGDLDIDLTGDFVARTRAGGRQSGIIAGTGLDIEPLPGQTVTNVLLASYATSDVTLLGVERSSPARPSRRSRVRSGD